MGSIIPESPRWLASRGRGKEALKILERIASSNKTTMPHVEDMQGLLEQGDQLSFRNAIKSKELRLRAFVVLSNM